MRQPFSFWLAAHSSKGHGVHSPLVYSFCREVLRSKWDGNHQEPMSLRSTILAWFLGYCSSCGYECCVFSEYSFDTTSSRNLLATACESPLPTCTLILKAFTLGRSRLSLRECALQHPRVWVVDLYAYVLLLATPGLRGGYIALRGGRPE